MRALGAKTPGGLEGHSQPNGLAVAARIPSLEEFFSRQGELLELLLTGAEDESFYLAMAGLVEAAIPGVTCAISIPHGGGTARTFSGRGLGEPSEPASADPSGFREHPVSELCRDILTGLSSRSGQSILRSGHLAHDHGVSWAEAVLDEAGSVQAVLMLHRPGERTPEDFEGAALAVLVPSIRSLVQAATKVRLWRISAERLDSISSALPGVVYQRVVRPDGDIRYTYITQAAQKVFGVEADRILADPEALFERHGPEYKARFRERLISASEKLTPWDVQATIVTEDGTNRFTHAVATPVRQADGSVVWTGLIVDETETRKAIIESLPQGILLFDRDDKLLLRNAAFVEMHPAIATIAVAGASYSEIISAEIEVAEREQDAEVLGLARRLENHSAVGSIFEQKSGDDRWLLINEHRTDEGGTTVIYTDITELKRRERRIQQLAYYDTLTGVANRALLDRRLLEALLHAEMSGAHVAVMCLDADKFKQVNDHFGHSGGDALLKAIAERLVECLPDGATVGRLGGDEFAVVIPGMENPKYCGTIANRILQAVNQPLEFMGQSIGCGISIGIASFPTDGSNSEKLFANADLALYRAKADGRGTFRFFSAEMDAEADLRRTVEVDLKQAINRCQLAVHYQPQINVGSDEVIGFEALVRWFHPERGQIPPCDFIPVAEETGFIKTLGAWVLKTACSDACAWPDHVKVAVNVSPVQFAGGGLFEVISEALTCSGLNPERLEIEITESALLRNVDATLEVLRKIKSLGVSVSMDDFGTGYSSLGNLRSFPFDKIKIDRSFVMDLERNPDSAAIVASIIGLGRNLGMTTCAEGVERREQLDCLKSEGCNEVQGFYYSKPQPVTAIAEMFAKRSGEVRARQEAGMSEGSCDGPTVAPAPADMLERERKSSFLQVEVSALARSCFRMARVSAFAAAPRATLALGSVLPVAVLAAFGLLPAAVSAGVASTLLFIALLGRSRAQREELLAKNEELQNQYARYRLIADTSSDVMLLKQPSGRRTYVSPASLDLLGLNEKEFLSTPSEEMVHPDDLERVAALNRNLSASAPHFRSVHRLRHRAGHYVWVDATFRLTETSEGEAVVLGMLRDVTEGVQRSEELEKAKVAAEKANTAKSEFLANMSHEMRTPLNCIIGYTDLLIEEEELSASQKEMCARVKSASSGLLALINDVLDLAKVDAGVIDLNPRVFDVDTLIRDAAGSVRPIAEKKGLVLFVDRDPDLPGALIGDDSRIRQVLLNLLGNAVKFTEKGNIGLTMKRLHSDTGVVLVRFEVADTGVGIRESELGRLFERFVQVDGSAQRRHNGAGIGLSLSKEIVSLMGGRVGVTSSPGVGSRFWFDIGLPAGAHDDVLPA